MAQPIAVAIIAAGAAILGSLVATFGTLRAAKKQHERTLEADRIRERNSREIAVTKRCSALLTSLAEVVRQQVGKSDDEQGFVKQGYKKIRLDAELAVESLYLREDARSRVDLARLILGEAIFLGNEVDFYAGPSSIALHVADHLNEVLAAHIKGEPLPEPTEMISDLVTALDYQDEQRHRESAEDLQGDSDKKHQWRVSHPPFRPVRVAPQPDGRFAFLRRRLKRG